MAKYWLIKSDNWRLNVAICSSLLIRTKKIASLYLIINIGLIVTF